MKVCSILFHFKILIDKSVDGVLGPWTRAAGWKAQMNPLSYGGIPFNFILTQSGYLLGLKQGLSVQN